MFILVKLFMSISFYNKKSEEIVLKRKKELFYESGEEVR